MTLKTVLAVITGMFSAALAIQVDYPLLAFVGGIGLAYCLFILLQPRFQKALDSDPSPRFRDVESQPENQQCAGIIECPDIYSDDEIFLETVCLEFHSQTYRIRQERVTTDNFAIYELIDPMTLGERSTLFIAVTQENLLYSVNIVENNDELGICYGPVSLKAIS